MKFYWDVDEVLRSITLPVYGYYPSKYDTIVPSSGKSFIETVNLDPTVCLTSPPSEYIELFNTQPYAFVLSAQLEAWRTYTTKWIKAHTKIPCLVTYVNNCQEKLDFMGSADWLIDDSPLFSSYDRIILVDRPHNQTVECEHRVKNPKELDCLIAKLRKI